jgi:hypothetical protein
MDIQHNVVPFPSTPRLSFDPMEIDFHKFMARYDDRRATVACAIKFAQLSSTQANEAAEEMGWPAFDSLARDVYEVAGASAALAELLDAVMLRFEAVVRTTFEGK